jgi:hypothetical protein
LGGGALGVGLGGGVREVVAVGRAKLELHVWYMVSMLM